MDYTSAINSLPVMPEVAAKIISIAEDKIEISFKELENIIKIDPVLTSKILKVANSSLYARQGEIKSLQVAITLLGFKNIKSLVLLISASSLFAKYTKKRFFKNYWKHSIITAIIAKDIAIKNNNKNSAEELFLAGLLHDIGKAILFISNEDRYNEILQLLEEDSLSKLEDRYFHTTHKDVGAIVLEKWNFPAIYIDIAKEHGMLNISSQNKTFIILVSIADLLCEKLLNENFKQSDQEILDTLVKYTSLSEKNINEYETSFLKSIEEDPFFKECKSLFLLD